jgi:YVTN family beta-propeller protein
MFCNILRSIVLLFPFLAVFAHAQTLLVLEKSDKTMAFVDATSLKVTTRVAAGEDPHEIVASDDGKFAYISNYGAFSNPQHILSVVDLAQRKALFPVDLGALIAPHGLQFLNGKVYFTAEGSKVIGRFDPVGRHIDWTLGLGQNRTHMLLVSNDENRVYTSNVNSDSISILDRSKQGDASGWIETTIPVGKGPEGFDVSPDGKELWAANSHDGTISIINLASRSVTQTFETRTQAVNRVKFTPDGKLVLLSDLRNGDLVVLDAATHKEMKRISLGRGCAGILIVPDGSRAYVAVSPDNNIAIVDLKTFAITARIPTGNGPDGMAWVAAK